MPSDPLFMARLLRFIIQPQHGPNRQSIAEPRGAAVYATHVYEVFTTVEDGAAFNVDMSDGTQFLIHVTQNR